MDGKTVKLKICCPEEIPDELRDDPGEQKRIVRADGKVYLQAGHTILSCDDEQAGRELLYELFLAVRGKQTKTGEKETVFLRFLNDPADDPDSDTLRRYRIDLSARRRIVVFRSDASMEKDLTSALRELAPMEDGDILVPVDYHTAALIRELRFGAEDELKEYCEAVIGTMETEGITGIRAGIGNGAQDPETIRNSYREGLDALATGMKYHTRESVYLFSGQTLDRILDSIPQEARQRIGKELFPSRTDAVLTDEMMETVRVFFRNDLNLTAASRQLFIHRNTLNYRLDKIKKETGLDLRSFEDAVIFRIISGLR